MRVLAPHVIQFANSEPLNLAGMVRNGLLMPDVSRLLGYSDFATPHAIPRWLAYPTLRFAHLMQTGLNCSQLDIRAARVPFGGVSLLSAAFSIQRSNETAFDYASFVMSETSVRISTPTSTEPENPSRPPRARRNERSRGSAARGRVSQQMMEPSSPPRSRVALAVQSRRLCYRRLETNFRLLLRPTTLQHQLRPCGRIKLPGIPVSGSGEQGQGTAPQ